MKQRFSNFRSKLVWAIFPTMITFIISSWFFVRFLHYDSQHRSLEPHTYQVQIISAEDYAKLGDRSLESVSLSDGMSIHDRQGAFYKHLLPNYKKLEGGDDYILVTTLGTSHFYDRWQQEMFPIAFLAVAGLVLSTMEHREIGTFK